VFKVKRVVSDDLIIVAAWLILAAGCFWLNNRDWLAFKDACEKHKGVVYSATWDFKGTSWKCIGDRSVTP
jgi:hypothetical protein